MTVAQAGHGDATEPLRSLQAADIKVQWAEKQIVDLEGAVGRVLEDFKDSKCISFDSVTGGHAGQPCHPPLYGMPRWRHNFQPSISARLLLDGPEAIHKIQRGQGYAV